MKTNVIKYVLSGVGVALAFLSFRSIDRAVNVPESSAWGIPILFFSLWFVFLTLFFLVEKRKLIIILNLAFSLGGSLWTVFSLGHLGVLFLGALLLGTAFWGIKKEIGSRIRIDAVQIVRLKRGIIVLAISLIVSSQYYFEVKDRDQAHLIPSFRLEEILGDKWGGRIWKDLLPENPAVSNPEMTVREAILENYYQEKAKNDFPDIQDENFRRIEEEKVVETGKMELEKMLGQSVSENDKVGSLFSDMINQRINETVAPSFSGGKSETVPAILSLALFLTVWSIGIFFSRLLSFATGLLFWIFRKMGLLKIETVAVEKEIIG